VAALVGDFTAGGFLPDDFARGAIKSDDDELVNLGRFGPSAEAAALPAFALLFAAAGRGRGRRWGRWGCGDLLRGFDGGQGKSGPAR